tara:strand:- start:527 stop:685 length:159 start_codon:yes stop_codon:yes gene_type:complete
MDNPLLMLLCLDPNTIAGLLCCLIPCCWPCAYMQLYAAEKNRYVDEYEDVYY